MSAWIAPADGGWSRSAGATARGRQSRVSETAEAAAGASEPPPDRIRARSSVAQRSRHRSHRIPKGVEPGSALRRRGHTGSTRGRAGSGLRRAEGSPPSTRAWFRQRQLALPARRVTDPLPLHEKAGPPNPLDTRNIRSWRRSLRSSLDFSSLRRFARPEPRLSRAKQLGHAEHDCRPGVDEGQIGLREPLVRLGTPRPTLGITMTQRVHLRRPAQTERSRRHNPRNCPNTRHGPSRTES